MIMFDLMSGMTASSGDEVSLETAAVGDNRRYGRTVPLMIPADQVYLWERVWQEGEKESEAERAAGRAERFGDADSVIRWLLTPED
jgi:antitoxin PrlF